jgi:protein PhnA
MTKGYEANKERQQAIAGFGKVLAKRAKFKCEWCDADQDPRPVDLDPAAEPSEATLALLCSACRELRPGKKMDTNRLRALSGAIWHPEPLVALGAARLLAASGEDWARDLIEDSLLDEATKAELLAR